MSDTPAPVAQPLSAEVAMREAFHTEVHTPHAITKRLRMLGFHIVPLDAARSVPSDRPADAACSDPLCSYRAEIEMGYWVHPASGLTDPDNAALREALAKSDAIRVTEEEDGWGVTLPELPGHVGAGDTLEEAVAMALDAAAAWGAALAAPASPSGSSPVPAGLDALTAALPRAINFRFLPPRTVDDPIWREVAADLMVALAPADPEDMTPEEEARYQRGYENAYYPSRKPADPEETGR